MRNLELLALKRNTNTIFEGASHFVHNTGSVYFLQSGHIHKYNFDQNLLVRICEQQYTGVTCLKILTIENKVCIVVRDTIHVIDADDYSAGETGRITFDNEIAAIEWNSSEELAAVVFADRTVATYMIDFYNFTYVCEGVSSVDADTPDTVYVGWGSKDTQFRGSEGKLALKKPASDLTGDDWRVEDRAPMVSWRGSGEMFAVNYWKDYKRMFIVYELPCTARYHSEECVGLGSLIAWRPAGNMIATVQEFGGNNRKNVVIFEKNGQKRFDFDFSSSSNKDTIVSIKWSPCAQFLAIESFLSADQSHQLTIMTQSNYKWYRKQCLKFPFDNSLRSFDWINMTQFTCVLRVITTIDIIQYTFKTTINYSSNNLSSCAVIDGKSLHLTLFHKAIIPPPLSTMTTILNDSINYVIFHPGKNQLATVNCQNDLSIFQYDDDNMTSLRLVQLNDILPESMKISKFPLVFHHFLWLNDNHIYFVIEQQLNRDAILMRFNVDDPDASIICCANVSLVRHVLAIDSQVDFIENEQINLMKIKFDDNDDIIDSRLYMNLQFETNIIDLFSRVIGDELYVFYLTSSNDFYINDSKISTSVSSFVISDDNYLLLTLKQNELYCIRLTEYYLKKLLQKLLDKNEFYFRTIEQGAKIIVCASIRDNAKVILQMPRGNIEIISCRLIAIDILESLLESNRWSEAIDLIRIEKLNANLLIDLNPKRFFEKIPEFIRATKTANVLNNICLEFENTNTLDTIYRKCLLFESRENGQKDIHKIFKKMLDYFNESIMPSYISTIVVINLHFFSLRNALIYIHDLFVRSLQIDNSNRIEISNAVNILKNYGCDDQKLYGEALLLYDLDFANFIALSCQMDPRIYQPQLSKLKELDEIERRYEINVLMKNWNIAISYLLRCPNRSSDDIINFINDYKVYRKAYEQCNQKSRHFTAVSRTFAKHLFSDGKYNEGIIILERAKLYEQSLDIMRFRCDNWQSAINTINKLNLPTKMEQINRLASELVACNRIKDAAIVYEHYAGNYLEALTILTRNCLFNEAIHVAKKFDRQDILDTDIIPAIMNYTGIVKSKLTESETNFNNLKTRLYQVRAKKVTILKQSPFDCDDSDLGENNLFSDVASIVSTTSTTRSSRSRHSTASSKNRRKEERKKQDLKEGGFYEDIAIIRALYILIKEIYEKSDDVKMLCYLLVQETDVSYVDIKELHDQYYNVMKIVNDNLREIWPVYFYYKNPTECLEEKSAIENIEHLDVMYRSPPNNSQGVNYWSLEMFRS